MPDLGEGAEAIFDPSPETVIACVSANLRAYNGGVREASAASYQCIIDICADHAGAESTSDAGRF